MPCVNYNGITACNVNPPNGLSHIILNENGTYEVWAYQPSLGEFAYMTVPASAIPTAKPTKAMPVNEIGEDEEIGLALEKMQIEKEQSTPKPVAQSIASPIAEPVTQSTAASTHKANLVYYIIIGIIALVIVGWFA